MPARNVKPKAAARAPRPSAPRRRGPARRLPAGPRSLPPFDFGPAPPALRSGRTGKAAVRRRRRSLLLRRRERLLEVLLDVVDVLDARRDADPVRRHAGALLLGQGELAVGRRRGVDDERLRVADVGEVGGELHRVDPRLARLEPALDPEGEDRAEAVLEVLARPLVVRVRLEAGVGDPRDLGVVLEPLRERERVLAVALDAEGERLDPLQEEERVERREGRPDVAQPLDARADDELDVAERPLRPEHVVVDEAVVAGRGLREARELAARAPVELSGIHDHPADGGAVAADPLRRRLHDDVRAPLDRAAEVAGGPEGVVDDERDLVLVRELRERLEVGDVVARVADRLDVERLRLRSDRLLPLAEVVLLDELRGDPEARQRHLELVVRAAVELRGGDEDRKSTRLNSSHVKISYAV